MNESPIMREAQCGGMSIILGDTVHGKHLEEIVVVSLAFLTTIKKTN